jgi:hypothetical protein
LIYDDHLYLGCGPFLQIYELGADGQLTFTGRVQTHDVILDIEHDGEYVYVVNYERGLSIYEGNDFYSPSEIANVRADYVIMKICLYGDSLLFCADHGYFGIMNISDIYNPYVERMIDDRSIIIPYSEYEDIFIHEHYMIADIIIRNPSPNEYLATYDLSADNVPALIDTVRYRGDTNSISLKVFDNRVYQQNDYNIQIYEITDGYLELKSVIDTYEDRIYPSPRGLIETNINGMNVMFAGIYERYPGWDSSFSTIYAYNVDNLANPVLLDSTSRFTNTRFWDLIQKDRFTYGLGDHL